MGLQCSCPPSAAIPNIPLAACKESIGQIQKVVFQRTFKDDGTRNKFLPNALVTPTPIDVLASWTPLLAAVDYTKVVQSPYLNGPTNEPGAAREYGGGNATLGGIPIIVGREPSSFEAQMLTEKQATIKAMKLYMCEGVSVYLIDEFQQIISDSNGLAPDAETLELYGFPINGLFIGDKKLGGLEEPDMNAIMWKFFPNWSDNLVVSIPTDFNALSDLRTPA